MSLLHERCVFSVFFKYDFRSSRSNADFLIVWFVKSARDFNMSAATPAVALDT